MASRCRGDCVTRKVVSISLDTPGLLSSEQKSHAADMIRSSKHNKAGVIYRKHDELRDAVTCYELNDENMRSTEYEYRRYGKWTGWLFNVLIILAITVCLPATKAYEYSESEWAEIWDNKIKHARQKRSIDGYTQYIASVLRPEGAYITMVVVVDLYKGMTTLGWPAATNGYEQDIAAQIVGTALSNHMRSSIGYNFGYWASDSCSFWADGPSYTATMVNRILIRGVNSVGTAYTLADYIAGLWNLPWVVAYPTNNYYKRDANATGGNDTVIIASHFNWTQTEVDALLWFSSSSGNFTEVEGQGQGAKHETTDVRDVIKTDKGLKRLFRRYPGYGTCPDKLMNQIGKSWNPWKTQSDWCCVGSHNVFLHS